MNHQLRTSARVVLLRGGAAFTQFVAIAALARWIGPVGLGEYQLFTSWAQICAIVVALGLPIHVLRRVSVAASEAHRQIIVRRALCRVTLAAVALSATVVPAIRAIEPNLTNPLLARIAVLALLGGILLALLRVVVEALKAGGRAELGLGLEFNVVPLVILVGLTLMVVVGAVPTPLAAIRFHITALVLGGAFAYLLWMRLTKARIRRERSKLSSPTWDSGHGLLWLQTIQNALFVNLPFLILPWYGSLADTGRFAAAHRIVAVAATLLGALAAVFGPRFARSFAASDAIGLKANLRRSQVVASLLYAPILLVFFVAPGATMRIFGAEFSDGANLLVILAVGHAVNAATGLVGYLLNMTKSESALLGATFVAALVLIALSFTLPFDVATNLAIASASSLALRSLLALAFARRVIANIRVTATP